MKLRLPQLSQVARICAAVAALGAGGSALLGAPSIAAALGVASAVTIGAAAWQQRRESARHAIIEEMVGAATSNAVTGRQLAIFERDTQLFAYWYVELRGVEECDRAVRYSRDLAIAVIEPTPGPDEHAVSKALATWLRAHKRNTDIVGYFGNGRYLVIMPETPAAQVAGFVQRIYRDVPHADIGIGAFPRDGQTYDALYTAAVSRLGQLADGDADAAA